MCYFPNNFLSSADFFSKSNFSKTSFRDIIRVSNSLDPDQARHFVRPDLGSNSLQKLSANGTYRGQRVKYKHNNNNINF